MESEKYELCDWVDSQKLDEKILERGQELELGYFNFDYWCDLNDDQVIHHTILRCIPMDLINQEKPWSKERLESARKWASRFSLNAVSYRKDEEELVRASAQPKFYRTTKLGDKSDIIKYTIQDGIHRIAVAKELGMDCILGVASETYIYTKADQ